MVVQFIVFLTLLTLICRSTEISKCFSESPGIRDNKSRLYLTWCTFRRGHFPKRIAFLLKMGFISFFRRDSCAGEQTLRNKSFSIVNKYRKINKNSSSPLNDYEYLGSSRKHAYIILTPKLNPNFYIVKLSGVYRDIHYFFLFLFKNIYCGYSLEPPGRGGSNEFPQSMFWAEIWKISDVYIWKLLIFDVEIFNIF